MKTLLFRLGDLVHIVDHQGRPSSTYLATGTVSAVNPHGSALGSHYRVNFLVKRKGNTDYVTFFEENLRLVNPPALEDVL